MKKLINLLKGVKVTGSDIKDLGLSLISDKIRDPKDSFVKDKTKGGRTISSKRVMNFTGSGAIVSTGLYLIFNSGLSWGAVVLVAIGALYSYGMADLVYRSEKSSK